MRTLLFILCLALLVSCGRKENTVTTTGTDTVASDTSVSEAPPSIDTAALTDTTSTAPLAATGTAVVTPTDTSSTIVTPTTTTASVSTPTETSSTVVTTTRKKP